MNFALFENQPSEIELLGVGGKGPFYPNLATGSVYGTFYCPDQETCLNLQPQLIYSALPSIPWSLSVPISWDSAVSNAWSAVGIDSGDSNKIVSFVDYNEDILAHAFTIYVYDSDGVLFDTGHTPVLLPLKFGAGGLGEGATYVALLRDVVSLPSGPFKVLFDGGPSAVLSAVSVLQFDGPSGTNLQVGYDSSPTGAVPAAAIKAAVARRLQQRQARVASKAKVFRSIRK